MILRTGNSFAEALALSSGTQGLVLFVMLFMPFYFALFEYYPILLVVWVLSAYAALYRVTPRVSISDPEAVMVRPGYPIDRKVAWGYALLIASVAGDLFVVLAIEIGIAWNYAQLPFLHLLSVFFLGLAVMAFWKGRGFYLEVEGAQTLYEIAVHYPTLKAASLGNVVLGHQFEHVIQSRVSVASGSPEALPGEVVAKTILQWVGSSGPYMLDAEKERNPHAVVLGSSGIGKTQTVKAVVLRYWLAKKIPSLIIDWTSEYANFVRDIGGVVWTVPANFTLNPLNLLGSSPSERTAEVEEALFYSIGLTALQATEVGKTILEAYDKRGIVESERSTWSRPTPTISDIIEVMTTRAETGYYTGEQLESVRSTMRKFHPVQRIFGEEETDFFKTVLRIPTCIDLSSLNDAAKAQVSYTVLQRIYRQFEILGFSKLRLLIVLDEAQLILTEKETTGLIPQKPLPVRIVGLGRKYGFGIMISTHLASDVPEAIRVNAATIVLLTLEEPDQLSYVRKWVNLSRPELDIYAELPQGGCFVKHLGERHAALVKVQMTAESEFEAARIDSASIQVPKAEPSAPTITRLAERTLTEQPMTAEEKLLQFPKASEPEKIPPPKETPVVSPPLPPPVSPLESELAHELTPDETRILNALSSGPVTMKDLSAKFPRIDYRKMLDILNDLDDQDLIQVERVANLEGKSTIYYAALRAEWVKSESLEHRAMLDIIERALVNLRPVRYGPTNPNYPDLGLENSKPQTCVELETGRKKFTPEELDEWARNVNERDKGLLYERVLVVVPSVAVERRYADACKRHNLELTTMGNLLAHLDLKR